jgi:hypothetical protein
LFSTLIFHINQLVLGNNDIIAIYPDQPGLTVQIEANDVPLREYDDLELLSNSRTVTKYVESQSGVAFRISYIFANPFPFNRDIGVEIHVDGHLIADDFIKKGKGLGDDLHYTCGIEKEVGSG